MADEWLKVQRGVKFEVGYGIFVKTEYGSVVEETLESAKRIVRHWKEEHQRMPPAIYFFPIVVGAFSADEYICSNDRIKHFT